MTSIKNVDGSTQKTNNGVSSGNISIKTEQVRNLTSDSERSNGSACYFANIKPHQILKIGTSRNLRGYIAEHKESKRNQVHIQIAQTLVDESDRFIQKNSGFTLVTDQIEVKEKEIRLNNPSIVNGGQTQGELRRFLDLYELAESDSEADFDTRIEILVEPDEDMQTEIAISRNTTTKVQSVSQAGARKHLDDLFNSMISHNSDYRINRSETDQEPIDTLLLLQITRLFMPDNVRSPSDPDRISESEILKSYKNKGKCLEEFSESYSKKDVQYDFIVNFAPKAWDAYLFWRSHKNWVGTNLQAKYGKKDERKKTIGTRKGGNGPWTDIVPGVLFPVLYGLHNFVEEISPKVWDIVIPDIFDVDRYLKTAKEIITRDCNYDPYVMGRSIGAYMTLSENPKSLKAALEAVKASQS